MHDALFWTRAVQTVLALVAIGSLLVALRPCEKDER
jgi:hypothetical protein